MAASGVDTGVSASTLEALERDFEDVIRDLGGEDNLERFRLEYEKLHRALKKSHEADRRLVKRCQELSQEIMANTAKIQSAIKMSQNDHNTIEAYKAQIEKAWKMVDAAHEKEARAKDTIQHLKKEAATLAALVDKGAALTHGQEVTLAQLTEENAELGRDRDALLTKIAQQIHEIKEKSEQQQTLDTNVRAKDEELRKVTAKLTELRREFEREVKSKERYDGQAKELMQVLQARNNEAAMRDTAFKEKSERVEKLTALIKDESSKKDELINGLQTIEDQVHDFKRAVEGLREDAEARDATISKLERDIEDKDKAILLVRYEEQKTQKLKDARIKQLKKVKQEQEDIEREHEMLQRQIVGLKNEIEAVVKDRAKHGVEAKKVVKAREKVDEKAQVEREAQDGVQKDILLHTTNRTQMGEELEGLKREITQLNSDILALEAERERSAKLASEANVKFQQAEREKRIAEMSVADLQKQIDEAARELVAQQSQYEQVRSDRNLYSKNLIEAQDEISEMKQKFKIMDHQIDQLKEELSMKEKKHFEAETNYKSLKEKLTKLRKRINTLMEQFKEANDRSESLSQEIKQLTKVINQCDSELSGQQEEFLAVTNQRDILGTQLIRRNDELALLYEKIRIQQSTLSKGEVMYRDRLVDIRMLRLKISELKRNVHMSQLRVKNIEELKAQTVTLTRQLHLERTKVQALSEELENPQNFLRWRKLEGSDPKPVEKVQKLQALQKRLISVTEHCVEKDILISEKDKLYVEMKTILARQPGPEVAEQLNIYQEDLRRLNTQMKCLASELNMSASQASEYKYEIERLNRQLQEAKKQSFEAKMNNQMLVRERTVGRAATM